jgi:SAM-dependent methyltransferase
VKSLPTAATAVDEVRNYYDLNTRRWFKKVRESNAIHRAVRGTGVRSHAEAFEYVDRLVLGEITEIAGSFQAPLHVLDLGCGVGASLIFLASNSTIRGTGVTISSVQAGYAAQHIREAGLADRVKCLEADFLHLPVPLGAAQVAFSIEAFIHSPDPDAYFAAAARHVVPGGLLIICDDFLTLRTLGSLSRREARLIHEVRSGWFGYSLMTAARADKCARQAGFRQIKNLDLTPDLDLRRPRDLLVALAVALGRHLPLSGYRWRGLVGGNALQAALLAGLIEFRFVVWRMGDTGQGAAGAFRGTNTPT